VSHTRVQGFSFLLSIILVDHRDFTYITVAASQAVPSLALAEERQGEDPELVNVGADLALWKSMEGGRKLVGRFSSFIMRRMINFPMRMGDFSFY